MKQKTNSLEIKVSQAKIEGKKQALEEVLILIEQYKGVGLIWVPTFKAEVRAKLRALKCVTEDQK